jgi:hypothetical protein
MNDDEIRFKKIFGLIPDELFNELSNRNMFKENWDSFLTSAIRSKLKEVDSDGQ